jgi:hypothetical protein
MSSFYPKDIARLATLDVQTAVRGLRAERVEPAKLVWSAAQATTNSTTGVRAAQNNLGSGPIVYTSGITNPPATRNLTATVGGTAGDIAAGSVIAIGTNIRDEVIQETLPAFTLDTAGTVVGNLAFKTVTSLSLPDMDGNGATVAVGFGNKLGLPFLLEGNSVLIALHGTSREGTLPTVVFDDDEIEKNTAAFATALNGSALALYLLIG